MIANTIDLSGRAEHLFRRELLRIPRGEMSLEVGSWQFAGWQFSCQLDNWLIANYLRRVLVPFIFCALSVLRNAGSSRSISSKYEDRAGVCWLAL